MANKYTLNNTKYIHKFFRNIRMSEEREKSIYMRQRLFMNNNEQDNYCWIQLAARTQDGKMIRNGYVRFDDDNTINQWRQRYNNTDVFRSICMYAEPSHRARYVVPLFFYVRSRGDFAEVRASAIQL